MRTIHQNQTKRWIGCCSFKTILIFLNIMLFFFSMKIQYTNHQFVDNSFQQTTPMETFIEPRRLHKNTVDKPAILHFNHVKNGTLNNWKGQFDTSNLTHPYLGARHQDGSYGMIVNPTVERLRYPKYNKDQSFVCPSNSLYGIEGQGGNQVLQKIKKGLQKSIQQVSSNASNKTITRPKILCMVYTVYTEESKHQNLAAIADTWGRRCDGFFGASNFSDHTIGAIDLPHLGPEAYGNMWQKIRTMWTYAYKHYLDEYDYFYICGDDTYVAIDNMRAYLAGPDVQRLENGYLDRITMKKKYIKAAKRTAVLRPRPLIFGDIMPHREYPVIAGGSGYVLNKAALQFYGEKLIDTCYNTAVESREDVFMASCFLAHDIFVSDTRDKKGGTRFGGSAEFTFRLNGHNSPVSPVKLQRMFGFEMKSGIDVTSEQQISFHLKNYKRRRDLSLNYSIADLTVRYHAFFYDLCDRPSVLLTNSSLVP